MSRFIKVRLDGPVGRRWTTFGRWWWLHNKGPIAPNLRVLHLDGDSLNDDPDNLCLGTAAENAFLWHDRDPAGSARNYAKCRAATAAHNRLRSQVIRAKRYLPMAWYPVDYQKKVIINQPRRKRWMVYADAGFPQAQEHSVAFMAESLGWPGIRRGEACILTALLDGPATILQLRDRVGQLRRLRSWRNPTPTLNAMRHFACMLRAAGLITSRRIARNFREYAITDQARALQRPACPIIPVRGKDLPDFPRADSLQDRTPRVKGSNGYWLLTKAIAGTA